MHHRGCTLEAAGKHTYLVVNTDVGPSGLAGLGVLVWVNAVFAHGDFYIFRRGEGGEE